jgi:hypothetical protein
VEVLFALIVAVGLLAGLAVPVLIVRALWRGLGSELRRAPPDRRRPAVAGGALAAVAVVAMSAIAIAAPWGPDSLLYGIAALGAVTLPVIFGAVAVQAVRDTRRARERRAQRSGPQ